MRVIKELKIKKEDIANDKCIKAEVSTEGVGWDVTAENPVAGLDVSVSTE